MADADDDTENVADAVLDIEFVAVPVTVFVTIAVTVAVAVVDRVLEMDGVVVPDTDREIVTVDDVDNVGDNEAEAQVDVDADAHVVCEGEIVFVCVLESDGLGVDDCDNDDVAEFELLDDNDGVVVAVSQRDIVGLTLFDDVTVGQLDGEFVRERLKVPVGDVDAEPDDEKADDDDRVAGRIEFDPVVD